MTEEPRKRCPTDDIICEMEKLSKMKNLRSAFDDEFFRKAFPSIELSELDESIRKKEAEIRQTLEGCNLPPLEDLGSEEQAE